MNRSAPLEDRRAELEQQLDESRHDLDLAVRDLRRATRRSLTPGHVARRHPWALLAAAAVVGAWIGVRHARDGSRTSPTSRRRTRR